jgi:hypothetical protein
MTPPERTALRWRWTEILAVWAVFVLVPEAILLHRVPIWEESSPGARAFYLATAVASPALWVALVAALARIRARRVVLGWIVLTAAALLLVASVLGVTGYHGYFAVPPRPSSFAFLLENPVYTMRLIAGGLRPAVLAAVAASFLLLAGAFAWLTRRPLPRRRSCRSSPCPPSRPSPWSRTSWG